MVYKNTGNKKFKIKYKSILFILTVFIYVTGVCTGCSFAFKNSRNIALVRKVTVVEELVNIENKGIFADCMQYSLRDLIMLCRVLVFKYSGVLKGLCLAVPFVVAVQNACIYAGNIYQDKLSVFNLFFDFILKDTAIVMILLIYTCLTANEILSDKYNPKKDIINFSVYLCATVIVYIIDITVKWLF